jgi:hypothetical protein
MLEGLCWVVQEQATRLTDLATWAKESAPLVTRHQSWEPELMNMQGKVNAMQTVLQQVGPALDGHGTKFVHLEKEMFAMQECLTGTHKNLEGMHRQLADMHKTVGQSVTMAEGLSSKMVQWENKVQELAGRCERLEASKGLGQNEGSVLNQLTGVAEVRKMCEDLRNELRDFTVASESRRAQMQGETGLSHTEVAEICCRIWNQKATELEEKIREGVAREFSKYVSQTEWSEARASFVPWVSFTKEIHAVASRCGKLETTVKSWEEEGDPPPASVLATPGSSRRASDISVTPVFINEPREENSDHGRHVQWTGVKVEEEEPSGAGPPMRGEAPPRGSEIQDLARRFGLTWDPKAKRSGLGNFDEMGNPFGVYAPIVENLRRDPEGRLVVLSHEKGLGLEPSREIKARLKKEFGLYPENWREPFGPGIMSPVPREEYSVNVIDVDGDDDGPAPLWEAGGSIKDFTGLWLENWCHQFFLGRSRILPIFPGSGKGT